MARDAVALFEVGNQLRDAGDLAGAESAWRAASQASHHGAALALGDLLYDRGDFDGAASEWSFAIGAEEYAVSSRAVINYGRLISETEFSTETVVGKHRNAKLLGGRDTAEADRLWRLAAESGDPDAAWAYIGLGRLLDPTELADEPDPVASEKAFQAAAETRHPEAAPCALLKLGRLQEHLGRQRDGEVPSSAIEALEHGFDSRHPEWAARCANQLAHIYANRGDLEQAARWFRAVAESGHADLAPYAKKQLVEQPAMEDEADVLFSLPCDDALALDAFDDAMQRLGWRGELEAAGSYDFRRGELGPHRLRCTSRGGLLSRGNRILVLLKQEDRAQTKVGLAGGTSREYGKLERAMQTEVIRTS